MEQEQLNQALHLTIQELQARLSDETATKNLFAVQLSELQGRVKELESLLEEYTQPRKEREE